MMVTLFNYNFELAWGITYLFFQVLVFSQQVLVLLAHFREFHLLLDAALLGRLSVLLEPKGVVSV